MSFTPWMWFSELLCFAAQLLCFFKLRRPASLRGLMLVLCAGNVLSVLTRGNALLYWDQLWLCRILAVLAFLWAVADVVSLPHKPLPALRLPVLGALVLAVPCWPLRPENGPAEMEAYRFAGLCLAVFVLVLHLALAWIAGSRRLEPLALRLLACLGAETAVSAATLLYRWPTQWQMLVWWTAIAFLAWGAVKARDTQDREPNLTAGPGCLKAGQAA